MCLYKKFEKTDNRMVKYQFFAKKQFELITYQVNPIGAGVVCTFIHPDGQAKMPYPSNFCLKHPMEMWYVGSPKQLKLTHIFLW